MSGRAGCPARPDRGPVRRAEPRWRAPAYLRGLLGNVTAEEWLAAGRARRGAHPDGMQRLLATADQDPDRVRDDLRAYVVEHLGDAGAVLVVDETGFLKKGTTSVGVRRQYSGTAGKVDNCQLGVFMAVQRQGAGDDRPGAVPARALDRRPAAVSGRAGPRAGRVPDKPGVARIMLERALDAEVPASWATADEVYGGSPALRVWLEEQQVSFVLAVKCTELLQAPGPDSQPGTRTSAGSWPLGYQQSSGSLAAPAMAPRAARLYDWTRIQLAAPATAGMAEVAAGPPQPRDGELAFYACSGPPGVPLGRAGPGGGTRWAVEEASRQARARSAWTTTRSAGGRAGIATSAWLCWPMPSYLAVTRAQATSPERTRGTPQPDRWARSCP